MVNGRYFAVYHNKTENEEKVCRIWFFYRIGRLFLLSKEDERGRILMELKKNTDVVDFLKIVSQCRGEVTYSTPEGDQLNLKSVLSQYVFGVLAARPDMLRTGKITCEFPEDYQTLQGFLCAAQ